jgi:hypothetical protein
MLRPTRGVAVRLPSLSLEYSSLTRRLYVIEINTECGSEWSELNEGMIRTVGAVLQRG